MAHRVDPELAASIGSSFDELLGALELQPGDREDHFVVASHAPGGFGRVFGGQLLAQAVVGACATVEAHDIHSLHATFVRAGTPGAPVEVDVTRVRDGRSLATRQVVLREEDRTLLVATASFAAQRSEPEVAAAPPQVAAPEDVPLVQEWAAGAPTGRHWIDRPPAVELRLVEAPAFLTGATDVTARSHWMRAPRGAGEDPCLHAALLAYASDFFLMDMIFRMHPDEIGPGRADGVSLDHAIWFHRPVRFDGWHLHTQEALALVGDRGLARGSIHDADGRLVASVSQEVLLRLGATS